MLHRQDEKRKSEERESTSATANNGGNFFRPPPPPLPAKFISDTPAQSLQLDLHGSSSSFTQSLGNQRPHSVMTITTPVGRDDSERESGSESRESSSNSNSNSNSESITKESQDEDQKNINSRRVKSTGDVETVTIHTSV